MVSLANSKINPDLLWTVLEEKLVGFTKLLALYDIQVRPYSVKAVSAWQNLVPAAQAALVQGFTHYVDVCSQMHAAGISLRDNRATLRASLRAFGFHAVENLESFLTQSNLAEIYNLEHRQVFRTINFFDYCNYSLLDLLSREWFDLYDRLASVTSEAMKNCLAALETGKMVSMTVPVHLLKEKDAYPRGVFRFDFRYCCPLVSDEGVLAGYLVTEDVEEVDVYLPREEKIHFLARPHA